MGMFFSNIHCRKNNSADFQAVRDAMIKMMADAGYRLADTECDDCTMYICTSNCGWVSVYSDAFSFNDPNETKEIIEPLSETLHTDVMAVSCFDSDYLFMHLINTADQTDAWANVGINPFGPMPRRSDLARWKNKVSDFEAFKAAVCDEYVFAEDVFYSIDSLIDLPAAHACLCDDLFFDSDEEGFVLEQLHFQSTDAD